MPVTHETWVRIPYRSFYGLVAQLVEQRTENPRVAGSIPALGIEVKTSCFRWDTSSGGRALDF